MQKLRIAHLGAGNSWHIQVLVRELARRGHAPCIVSGTNYEPFTQVPGVDIHTFDSNLSIPAKIMAVRRILKNQKIDILHSHYVHHGGITGALSRFRPHVLSAWGDDILLTPYESLTKRVIVSAALLSADVVLPVSDAMGAQISKLTFGRVKPTTWHWGVDGSHFQRNSNHRTAMRQRWGINDNELVVYSPRLLWPDYYHDVLVNAWPEVLKQVPNAKLILKKTGNNLNYEQMLRELCQKLRIEHSVIWIDSLSYEDLPASYSAADVVVSLPMTEGTPITLLEALACETIVVAADILAVHTWVKENETGYRSALKPAAVAQAVVHALVVSPQTRQTMGYNGRKLVIENAERTPCMDQLERIYFQSLESKNSGSRL